MSKLRTRSRWHEGRHADDSLPVEFDPADFQFDADRRGDGIAANVAAYCQRKAFAIERAIVGIAVLATCLFTLRVAVAVLMRQAGG